MHNNHQKVSIVDGGEVSTARLETLTDGIFAIAMTILVLNIHLPDVEVATTARDLLFRLSELWPTLASFIVSFIILGMFWVAHHTEFRFIKKLDNKLIWLNMFYLLFVSLLPFSAALLGRFNSNQTAVIVYGLHLMAMVLLHYFIWRHASHRKNLVEENLDPRLDHLVDRVTVVATLAYILAIIFSFWNLNVSLIFYALTPLPYIFGWIYYLV